MNKYIISTFPLQRHELFPWLVLNRSCKTCLALQCIRVVVCSTAFFQKGTFILEKICFSCLFHSSWSLYDLSKFTWKQINTTISLHIIAFHFQFFSKKLNFHVCFILLDRNIKTYIIVIIHCNVMNIMLMNIIYRR